MPELCDKSKIYNEYKFEYNESNKFADVAYLKDNKIIQIYEICYTHKTNDKNRPEPWFELKAENILEISNNKNNDIELTCIRNKKCNDCYDMEKLKGDDLEQWIRTKLKGKKIDFSGSNCGSENCNNCSGGNGNNSCNDYLYTKNKYICELFVDDLNTNRIVIYSWKGSIIGYIISKEDFSKFDYWNNKYWSDGINRVLTLPYLHKKLYCGWGTVDILKDLIKKCKYIIPENNCKSTKHTHQLCIDKYSKYWQNSIYNWRFLNINQMKKIYYDSLFKILDLKNDFKNNIYKKNKNTIFEDIYYDEYYKSLNELLEQGKEWKQWNYEHFDKKIMFKFIKIYKLIHPVTILKNCMLTH